MAAAIAARFGERLALLGSLSNAVPCCQSVEHGSNSTQFTHFGGHPRQRHAGKIVARCKDVSLRIQASIFEKQKTVSRCTLEDRSLSRELLGGKLPLRQKSGPPPQHSIACRISASSTESLPARSLPESWPIEPPLEKVEHERYMYPADTLPGYVRHSKDPRVPVKHKTVSSRIASSDQ
jgi:hypothetical protein